MITSVAIGLVLLLVAFVIIKVALKMSIIVALVVVLLYVSVAAIAEYKTLRGQETSDQIVKQ